MHRDRNHFHIAERSTYTQNKERKNDRFSYPQMNVDAFNFISIKVL